MKRVATLLTFVVALGLAVSLSAAFSPQQATPETTTTAPTSAPSESASSSTVATAVALQPISAPPTIGAPARRSQDGTPTSLQAPTTSSATLEALLVPDTDVTTSATREAIQKASSDAPVLYEDGCHLGWSGVTPKQCVFGDLSSQTTIVLTGDSHAAHWFGALEVAAIANNWRLVPVTKSGCPAADVSIYSSEPSNKGKHVAYEACAVWRKAAQEYIRSLKPALVVFPMLSRRDLIGKSGQASLDAWRDGIAASIRATTVGSSKALVISDTPKTSGDSVPACLMTHMADQQLCSTSRSVAVLQDRIDAERSGAALAGAYFSDITGWICSATTCGAVVDGIVAYRDEHHLTDSFSRAKGPRMALVIQTVLGSLPS